MGVQPQTSVSPRLRHQNTVGGSMGQLLDTIAIGESGGSYTVAFSNRGALEVPELTSMTIDEVLDFQRAHVRAGNKSSASGRYQLLRKTLEGLVEKYDIPRTMRFDPSTQDALAILLMQDAGLGAYMSGRLSPEKFSARLAGIWAALPKDASGRGVYDGDGINKASQRWSDTLAIVQGLRRRQPMA
ncbi:MAG: hypothetical protein EOM26_13975 [Alphaproteobacteria bacterium]|nr:hypothetical protein [Alphaproteobacteria bacterium]